MRGGVADLAGLRGSVNPVMIFGEVDPCEADRVVRAGGERLLVGGFFGVPEELRIVMEFRFAGDAVDLPLAERQGIVFAADGGGIERKQLVTAALPGLWVPSAAGPHGQTSRPD